MASASRSESESNSRLSDLVRAKVSLTRTGKEWKGLCPFHEEATPSFYVNDDKGIYHCFGCSAHGGAEEWIAQMRELSTEMPRDSKKSSVHQKKGGGKLARSETVTVRLDPKLNYLCDLASRAQRRTKSSFIEWAVAEALGAVHLSDIADSDFDITLKHVASQLWHVDEPDRMIALALTAPALLTHEEQMIWRLVRENGYIWRGRYNAHGEWSWTVREDDLIRDRLREYWDKFKAVASGDESERALPSWNKRRAPDLLDDDVPF